MDIKLASYIINRIVPFHVVAKSAGYDLPKGEGVCFCIFHENVNTPSAKLFKDKDGDRLWCFAENKMYRPYDLFRLKMIKKDPELVAEKIWDQLSEAAKQQILEESGQSFVEKPKNWDQFQVYMNRFREGTCSYEELLSKIFILYE